LDNQIKNIGKFTDLLIVIIAAWFIPKLSGVIADFIYPFFKSFDPDEIFLWITIHHIFQLAFTIIVMLMLSRKLDLKQWGFNFKNWDKSLMWIGVFLIIFGAQKYFGIMNRDAIQFDYPLTQTNKLGIQFFQYFLSGLAEEPLFRGLVMVFLAKNWSKIFKVFKVEFPITIVIATILFMIAHVQIDFGSLTVDFDFGQQIASLQLGILYGLAFHYTKSLLAPIVLHGLFNGIPFTIMYYATF